MTEANDLGQENSPNKNLNPHSAAFDGICQQINEYYGNKNFYRKSFKGTTYNGNKGNAI